MTSRRSTTRKKTGRPAPRKPAAQVRAKPAKDPIDKATFWLPSSLLDRLDHAWIQRRRRDRRVHKSDLVREALEAHLT